MTILCAGFSLSMRVNPDYHRVVDKCLHFFYIYFFLLQMQMQGNVTIPDHTAVQDNIPGCMSQNQVKI